MPLTTRFTRDGRTKQAADELEGWRRLAAIVAGTPAAVSVAAATTMAGGLVTGFNTGHPNYAQWRPAHRVLTRRARQERQRQQQVAAAPALGPLLLCHVNPALVVRPTVQIAIVTETTSDVTGNHHRSIAVILAHLRTTLEALENELLVRARHRELQDLTINGAPPTRIMVAAEWFFRPALRAYTTAEHAAVLAGLRALSREFPDWLLVPGSIYWSPDAPATPIIRVFNQAVVLYAGDVIATRTKRNEHDIPAQTADHEEWGMNAPAGPVPAAIAGPSLVPTIFNHAGAQWALDVCRDHYVGEAARHYVVTFPASVGPDIYIVTSNNTVLADEFLAVRNNGLVIHCDGGTSTWQVHRVTRPGGLNAIAGQLGAHDATFIAQRAPGETYAHTSIRVHQAMRDPAYVTFRARYDVMMNPATGDPMRGALNGLLAIAGLPHTTNTDTENAFRITQILAGAMAVGGVATSVAEQAAMTAYAALLHTQGVSSAAWQALCVPGNATALAKAAITAALVPPIVKAAQAPLAHQPTNRATLFPLQDV